MKTYTYKGYTTNPNTSNNYALYAENVITGHVGIYRYFSTIRDALYYVNNISLSLNKLYCWRLVRVSDSKSFTSRIYKSI